MFKKIALWIIQIVLSLFVISGAINDGFTYFILAIPFALLFLIIAYRSKNKIHRIYGLFILMLALFFIVTRSSNPILYSSIGERINFKQPIPVAKFTNKNGIYSYDEDTPLFSILPIDKQYVESKLTLPEGEYRISSIRIDHPDFGTQYYYYLTNLKTNQKFQVGSVMILSNGVGSFFDKVGNDIQELAKLSDTPEVTIQKFRSIRPVFYKLSLLMAFPILLLVLKN